MANNNFKLKMIIKNNSMKIQINNKINLVIQQLKLKAQKDRKTNKKLNYKSYQT